MIFNMRIGWGLISWSKIPHRSQTISDILSSTFIKTLWPAYRSISSKNRWIGVYSIGLTILEILGCSAQTRRRSILKQPLSISHRHLSNIDCLMACTTCHVCFINTVNTCSKKKENASKDVALVAGTQQNLSNLYFLDIYGISLCSTYRWISKEYRLLKFCCVPATSATSSKAFSFFLLWTLTVLMKQIRQAVHAIKQSILLRRLWTYPRLPIYFFMSVT